MNIFLMPIAAISPTQLVPILLSVLTRFAKRVMMRVVDNSLVKGKGLYNEHYPRCTSEARFITSRAGRSFWRVDSSDITFRVWASSSEDDTLAAVPCAQYRRIRGYRCQCLFSRTIDCSEEEEASSVTAKAALLQTARLLVGIFCFHACVLQDSRYWYYATDIQH